MKLGSQENYKYGVSPKDTARCNNIWDVHNLVPGFICSLKELDPQVGRLFNSFEDVEQNGPTLKLRRVRKRMTKKS
jgi:hypothetical protein